MSAPRTFSCIATRKAAKCARCARSQLRYAKPSQCKRKGWSITSPDIALPCTQLQRAQQSLEESRAVYGAAAAAAAAASAVLKKHHVQDFVCDSLRMAITGIDAFDLDQLLDLDLEVHHHDASQPTTALSTMADSMPGLGIVAAVLGVVITMQAMGGPPEEIGKKVAAALVGTFLGILLCYGLIGPIAANMSKAAEEEHAYLYVLRVLMISFLRGTAPIMAVEVARRAIPGHVRPSFREVEAACRKKTAEPATEPQAAAATAAR